MDEVAASQNTLRSRDRPLWQRRIVSNSRTILFAELRAEAQATGKTVDQLAEEALRKGLATASGGNCSNTVLSEAEHQATRRKTYRTSCARIDVAIANGPS